LALKIGNNSQLKSFFKKNHVEHTKPEHLYKLSSAIFYRKQLSLELWRRLGPPLQNELTDSDLVVLQQMLTSNGNMNPVGGLGEGEFFAQLESMPSELGTLGLTLTETHGGRAVVQKVENDGIASFSGIKPGDYLVGVGGDREWRYKLILPRVVAWASRDGSVAKIKVKKSTTAQPTRRLLVLTIWRPQWSPDAFTIQSLQAFSGQHGVIDDDASAAQRTAELLQEGGVVGGGIGSQDWKSFLKVNTTQNDLCQNLDNHFQHLFF
jgi:hypothetical protein